MVKLSQALTKSWSNIIIWMLFVIPSCVLSVDDGHKKCTSWFRCGKHTHLNYPFWTPERGEDCGHPDFKVNCDGDFAEFSVKTVKFRILEMNNESRLIRVARMDYLNDVCPEYPENATINQQVLSFPPDTQLQNFYYDCPPPSIDFLPSGYITKLHCDDAELGPSYFVSSPSDPRNRAILDRLSGSCDRYVNIPVSRSALIKTTDKNHSEEALKKALDEGFEVRVNSDCSGCIKPGGACGPSCPKKGLSKEAKIGMEVACGFLGATLIAGCVFCFITRRRKKQWAPYTSRGKPPTTPSASNTASTTPSSTTMSRSNHSRVPSISNLANESVYSGVQVFSYEELEEATENFSIELGGGGFGIVYYGILKDGRAVAVKRLFEKSLNRVEQFKNEIEIFKSLKHPNLVILYGCTTRHSRELLFVYEYISNVTLADHLYGNQAGSRPLSWPARLKIAIETASALSFLHTTGIIHRDVKSTNILLDSNYQVKVADFGLSRLFRTDQTHISTAPQGTPGYVDPEYYQCYCLTEKSDVYSFGVVLSELISSKEAVDTTRHRHDINLSNMAIDRIQNDAVHELADLSLGFARDHAVKWMMMSVAELALRCLQQEREVRPSMDEIVKVLRGIQDTKIA